jgi:ankyrin repeat protein
LLIGTDNEGRTDLHEAAYEGKLDILLQVWEWAEEKLTTEEINNKLLLATDNEGRTAWHGATYVGNPDIL